MTRLRRVVARPLRPAGAPGVSTLDDALWDRVGRLLVARGRLTRDELASALAEHRRTRAPLDEILIERKQVTRHEVASTILAVQLGSGWHKQHRTEPTAGRSAAIAGRPEPDPLPDVPASPRRAFALACLGVDVAMLAAAAIVAALARGRSNVQLPPSGWMAVFAALALALYWSWRLYTFRTKLRPLADSLLVAGASGLAAMAVLTIRSLAGEAGVADELLPLWAFTAVYGVAGRMGFYLAWSARPETTPEPVSAAQEPPEPGVRGRPVRSAPPAARRMDVVPLRPELWGVLDELRREVDALVREQRDSELGGAEHGFAEAG